MTQCAVEDAASLFVNTFAEYESPLSPLRWRTTDIPFTIGKLFELKTQWTRNTGSTRRWIRRRYINQVTINNPTIRNFTLSLASEPKELLVISVHEDCEVRPEPWVDRFGDELYKRRPSPSTEYVGDTLKVRKKEGA